jgi:phosphomannomutase
MINQSIFKSYDVRGIYPTELNEEAAFAVGSAFVRKTGAKSVVIGHDTRLSSPELFKGLARGVISEGAQVYDIGKTSTEGLYFAVGNYEYPSGIMVTASHNPKEYNGFKMLQRINGNIEMVRGVELIPLIVESASAKEPLEAMEEEQVFKKDIWQDFTKYVLASADLAEIVPLKIVIDASNGVGGLMVSKIQDKLPVEIIPLNFEPDGNFPNHSPNPLEKGSADKIGEMVKKENADFGLMFDGDADRIFLVDENGQLVSADITLLFLAKFFLQKNPGMSVAYNAICSKAVPEFIEKWGGKPIRTKVGFVNVREGLLKNNGIMGGELSGHYCYKDYYYMDSGIISFLTLLQIIAKDGRKVSEIVKEFSVYAKSAENNFKVVDKDAILEKIKEKYVDGKQDFLDGITVEYADWWFNVRPSNTEPVLRLTVEADTPEILDKKIKELTKVIIK